MDWLAQAKLLPIGQNKRISCCRDDRSAIISSSIQGWSYYCFRCGEHKFVANKEGITPQQFIGFYKATENINVKKCELPSDFTTNIPEEGLKWLRKAGIDEDLRNIYNIGYSNSKMRVILPVEDDRGKLIYMQQRAVYEGQSPKYINVTAHKKPVFQSKMVHTDKLVITEDILSAIKVGQMFSTISILGTKPVDCLLSLIQYYKRIYIWLDNDEAGHMGAIKVARYCEVLGIPVTIIRSERDPKYYSKQKIVDIIAKGYEDGT